MDDTFSLHRFAFWFVCIVFLFFIFNLRGSFWKTGFGTEGMEEVPFWVAVRMRELGETTCKSGAPGNPFLWKQQRTYLGPVRRVISCPGRAS